MNMKQSPIRLAYTPDGDIEATRPDNIWNRPLRVVVDPRTGDMLSSTIGDHDMHRELLISARRYAREPVGGRKECQ